MGEHGLPRNRVATREELDREFAPQSDAEAMAAARAVYDFRALEGDLEQLRALTPFEQFLIEYAYDLGYGDATAAAVRAIGSAAATVDAPALRSELGRKRNAALDPVLRAPEGLVSPANERAARLVANVRRRAQEADRG